MPSYVGGTGTSGQAKTDSGANLVTKVARVVGGERDNAVRVQALSSLNRARIELNMHDLAPMIRTITGDTNLVAGTANYTISTSISSSTMRKVYLAQLVDSAGIIDSDLEFKDWNTMAHWIGDFEQRGRPLYYTMRNPFDDNFITLVPTPDAGAAADFDLRILVYIRIPSIGDSITDSPNIPEEVEHALIAGGQAYLLQERLKDSPATPRAFADWLRIKDLLMVHHRREPDQRSRFTIGPHANLGTPRYIKVSI